jgi:hypothetical protein
MDISCFSFSCGRKDKFFLKNRENTDKNERKHLRFFISYDILHMLDSVLYGVDLRSALFISHFTLINFAEETVCR